MRHFDHNSPFINIMRTELSRTVFAVALQIASKMLRLTICLLVAKTAFAANAFPVDTSSYGPVGPNTNLVFNFEQIRRDQPPHIEMREENIHKYMNRPRTTPTPIDNGDMSPMHPEHPIPYTAAQWSALQTAPKYDGPVSNWKSVPAPPSFPHWDSLSNKAMTSRNNFNGYENQPVQHQPIVVDEPSHWHEPEIHSRAVPNYVPTTVPPMTTARAVPVENYGPRRNPSGRGQHKFNWSEVSTELPTTVFSMPVDPTTTAPTRGPPPPVPTLSPWYDGF